MSERTEHTVRAGDTLSHIALRYYRDARKWKAIYDANVSEITREQYRRDETKVGPHWIYPGMKLRIPPAALTPDRIEEKQE